MNRSDGLSASCPLTPQQADTLPCPGNVAFVPNADIRRVIEITSGLGLDEPIGLIAIGESGMKTLIFMQCLIRDAEEGRFVGLAFELARRLNTGADFLLIDNASPLNPLDFLGAVAATIHRFPSAIGHFNAKYVHERNDPRDGPGRAIMTALQIAMASGYDRAVYLESDCLFARPVEWGFSQMTKPTACCPRTIFGWLDWQVWWIADLRWLREHRFVEKYDWPNQTSDKPEGDLQYETSLGKYLQALPVKGSRGDFRRRPHVMRNRDWIRPDNIHDVFPDGCDFLTHVSPETFAEFLKMNGFPDLVDRL
jgi:hypothetical protein